MKSTIEKKDKSNLRLRLTTGDILWLLLARTQHIVSKIRHKELRQSGVTINEAAVLFTILRLKKPATPASISQEVHWEPHTVSELLKVMEKKGTIRKVRDLERKNLIRVAITDKGIEAYRRSSQRKSTRQVMSALSKEEQIHLWTLLGKVRDKGLEELGLSASGAFPPSEPNKLK